METKQSLEPVLVKTHLKIKLTMRRACNSLCLLTLAVIAPVITSLADQPNGRILASQSRLNELLSSSQVVPCDRHRCDIDFKPITITLNSPRGDRIRLALTSARISIPASPDPEDVNTRPILLKGMALESSRPNSLGEVSVAATIFRHTTQPTIEIAIATPTRVNKSAVEHTATLTIFRAPIALISKGLRLNARVNSPSAYAFGQRICGANSTIQRALPSSKAERQEVRAKASYKVLYVATDYDSQFATSTGCSSQRACNNKIISAIHRASVFYEAQLGHTFEVVRQFGPSNPGRSTASAILLDSFQELVRRDRLTFMHTGSNSSPNQFDMIQLFTGRSMDNDVIGVAYVGTVCQNTRTSFASSVIQRVSDALDPVTSAHEIGHTLNAQHVASGIMKASLASGSPPQSFSTESVSAMNSYLNQWYGECRQGISDGTRTPVPTPTPTPNPTPTRVGGGSPSGSNPYTGVPVTASLNIRGGTRTMTITTNITSLVTGCSIRLRAGASSLAALTGATIADYTPDQVSSTLRATVTNRVRPTKSNGSNLHFLAEYRCDDGTIREVSRTIAFNPNRIRRLDSRSVTKRTWLSQLSNSVTVQQIPRRSR